MDKKRVFEKYKRRAEHLLKENDNIKDLLGKTSVKLKGVMESNDKLKEFTDQLQTLYRMIKAQARGEYTVTPWKTLVMIAGALLYFITPIDMIPDFIPGLGLTDDIAIVYWIYNSIREDIAQFELWEKTIEIEVINEG